jgi:hypothetical protein
MLASDVELFHTPTLDAYATILVSDHLETWPLKSKGFKQWLTRRYYEQTQSAPGGQGLQDALGVLEAKARYEGPMQPVYIRLAEHEGAIFLDLANEHWEAVWITSTGWSITAAPPVKFRRSAGMLPLPTPVMGGTIDQLRPFLNLDPDRKQDWMMVVAWLLASLRARGPYPLLIFHGEQGTGKSWMERIMRALIDPNVSPLRGEPRNVQDLMISGLNAWVLAYDNLSRIPPWLSDALCRLATGGGFSTRELYADTDEVLIDVQRPVMLNGIEELATRADLLDRALLLDLPCISSRKMRTETDLWQRFETARPAILGALLTAVSGALRRVGTTTIDWLPRLADFAVWTAAAEPGLGWGKGAFLAAYEENRDSGHELALEASLVVPSLASFMADRAHWTGTATELLSALGEKADESVKRQDGWPKNAHSLSNRLRRLAPNLRRIGLGVRREKTSTRQRARMIVLERIDKSASGVSEMSEVSAIPIDSWDAPTNIPPRGNDTDTGDMDGADAGMQAYSEPFEVNLDDD